MLELSRAVIGTTTGKRTFEYAWRDVVIYALGVGAKADELEYLYEKNLKAIPTFGVVPCWGTFGITPYHAIPHNAAISLIRTIEGGLHMTQELVLHRPVPPMGARLTFEDVVANVYDWAGKGAVIQTVLTAFDEAGEKVFTNTGTIFVSRYAAPGAGALPKSAVEIPDRDPDIRERDFVPANQHQLYRLSGDTNLMHVDPEEAAREGFSRPLMQGLCTFGYACRLAVKNLVPGEPERVKRMATQFRNPLFPGSAIELQLWKTGAKQAFFRVMDLENGRPALDRGVFEWD